MTNASRKCVIFDRDGTLIVDKIYLNDPQAVEYLPGVFAALKELRDAGYVFAVATNQSGVARGIVQIENLQAIHRRIRNDFAHHGIDILGFYYAPYMTNSGHFMRKPCPGMLQTAAQDFRLNLRKSWMVGDRMTDVEAGHRAGARSVLLSGLEKPEDFPEYLRPEIIASGLEEAAHLILRHDSLHF